MGRGGWEHKAGERGIAKSHLGGGTKRRGVVAGKAGDPRQEQTACSSTEPKKGAGGEGLKTSDRMVKGVANRSFI